MTHEWTLMAALLALPVCAAAEPVARALGVMDIPDARKLHGKPTPLVGGIAASLPFLAVCLTLAVLAGTASQGAGIVAAIAAVVAVSLLLGFFDDRRHLSPVLRLGVAAATVAVAALLVPHLMLHELRFPSLGLTVPLGLAALPFTILCLVGLQNAVNMADGQNGIVSGAGILWGLALMLIGPTVLVLPAAVLTGALAIVLVFNLRGRLFLGDAGSYALAMAFGLMAIVAHGMPGSQVSAETVLAWFLVPVTDCVRLMVVRVRRGQSPFKPDNTHLHHILRRRFRRWRTGLAVYWLLVALPIAVSVLAPALILPTLGVTLASYAVILKQDHRRLQPAANRLQAGASAPVLVVSTEPAPGASTAPGGVRPAVLAPTAAAAAIALVALFFL